MGKERGDRGRGKLTLVVVEMSGFVGHLGLMNGWCGGAIGAGAGAGAAYGYLLMGWFWVWESAYSIV